MVHECQSLPLGLESCDDLFGIHSKLDDLERDAPSYRLSLLRHVNCAEAAFAQLLQQLVTVDYRAYVVKRCVWEVRRR